jgi:hypothetical protein
MQGSSPARSQQINQTLTIFKANILYCSLILFASMDLKLGRWNNLKNNKINYGTVSDPRNKVSRDRITTHPASITERA